jgi:hypothetical protein
MNIQYITETSAEIPASTTDIAIEPELYCPMVNNEGNYSDKIPHIGTYGIRCPCSRIKNKLYMSYSTFSAHVKTKMHQKWLEQMNQNKHNFYLENIRLQEIVNMQKITIAKLEKEINIKIHTIDILTNNIQEHNNRITYQTKTIDLLDY